MVNKHHMFCIPFESHLPASESSVLLARLHDLLIAAIYCAGAHCCMHMVAPVLCSCRAGCLPACVVNRLQLPVGVHACCL